MKKILIGVFVLACVAFGIFVYANNRKPVAEKTMTPIRIGWQIPWATEGQLTQVLKNTPLLQDNGLVGEFKGFTAGPQLNEAALAGEVDVLFTADQPVATLLGKNPNWVIIGRLMYNRVALYVPPKSPITTIADLKGKTVGMPFGAAAQRMALLAEKEAGVDPKNEVKNVNLDIYAQSDLVKDVNAVTWGTMDALAGFDPTPAIFEEKGLVRTLKVGKIVSVIAMSKDYIAAHPDSPVQFLKAFNGAYAYYRANVAQADAWFTAESKLTITPSALAIASSLEPNLITTNPIRLGFTDEDYAIMQEAADFIYDQSLVKTKVTMKDHVDMSYLEKASLQ